MTIATNTVLLDDVKLISTMIISYNYNLYNNNIGYTCNSTNYISR